MSLGTNPEFNSMADQEIAKQTILKLGDYPDVTNDEIAEAQNAFNPIPQIRITIPLQEIDVTLDQIALARQEGRMGLDLSDKLTAKLNEQRAIIDPEITQIEPITEKTEAPLVTFMNSPRTKIANGLFIAGVSVHTMIFDKPNFETPVGQVSSIISIALGIYGAYSLVTGACELVATTTAKMLRESLPNDPKL